jgi:UDP-N-acetylglucosamine 4,6-dehydratase
VRPFSWENATILVTGGTGSFGRRFVDTVLREQRPRKIIVFSRDELKQHEMRQHFPDGPGSPMRYFIGDVRDADRLRRAFTGVDLVVHAAALKQVPACEYNPFEAVQTNIQGAKNIVDAAIDVGVPRIVALSTDKAVAPVNLYGATKLVAEKIVVQGNSYSSPGGPRFSCVRYGNVVGSRGSVIPLFEAQKPSGVISMTDARMTRFWITLEQGVRLVMTAAERMHGGEVFIPKLPSMRITDLAEVLAPGCEVRMIGIRPGEKIHETLISEDETRQTLDVGDMYVIQPMFPWWESERWSGGTPLPEGFRYSSDVNDRWLAGPELLRMIEDSAGAYARH